MIAMFRRVATYDSLLLAVSVSVITLTLWPTSGVSRQPFCWRNATGQTQTYSLAVDDPRLQKLRKMASEWGNKTPSHPLTIAKWRKELADFYAKQLAGGDNAVVQASFAGKDNTHPGLSPSPRSLTPDDRNFWLQLSADASRIIAAENRTLQQRTKLAGPSPIVFGELIEGRRGRNELAIGVFLGILTAAGFAIWSRLSPVIQIAAGGDTAAKHPREIAVQSDSGIRMEIPREWVRIRQPLGVSLRRLAYAILVLWALSCVVI